MSISTIDKDSLNIILSLSEIYVINICSYWNDIIKKHLITCSECKKIVKIYDMDLWKSNKAYICHDELVKSKIVDVQLNYVGKKFFNILEQYPNPEIRITFANETNNNHIKLNIIGSFYKVDMILNKNVIERFNCNINNVNFLISIRSIKQIIRHTCKMVCSLVLNVKLGYKISQKTKNRYLILESDADFIMKFDDGRSSNIQTMPINF